jgi:hypothetical protein
MLPPCLRACAVVVKPQKRMLQICFSQVTRERLSSNHSCCIVELDPAFDPQADPDLDYPYEPSLELSDIPKVRRTVFGCSPDVRLVKFYDSRSVLIRTTSSYLTYAGSRSYADLRSETRMVKTCFSPVIRFARSVTSGTRVAISDNLTLLPSPLTRTLYLVVRGCTTPVRRLAHLDYKPGSYGAMVSIPSLEDLRIRGGEPRIIASPYRMLIVPAPPEKLAAISDSRLREVESCWPVTRNYYRGLKRKPQI